ncbi:MAG: hypothetical protein ACUVTD_04150 [Nitrososphaerales archaeon]
MRIDIPRVNNFWIDNGIVVLGRWLWEAGYKPRLEATKLIVDLTEKEFEKIVDNQIRERYLKQKQLRALQPFIKQYTTAEPWKKNIFFEKKESKLTCSFCGRFTSDEKHLTLGRAIFPLTNTRFPAFRSNRTEFSYICPICYVLGRLAPFNTFFCLSGTNYFYFIPYSHNLIVLSEIKPLLEKIEERSNYTNRLAEGRKGFYHTDKFYEEILGVLYYCFLELNKMGKIDIFKSLNEFYCFQYDGMLIVDFLRFEKTKELYELFSKLVPKIEVRSLSKVFNYFYAEDDEYLRNEFCKHLLEFSHISVG